MTIWSYHAHAARGRGVRTRRPCRSTRVTRRSSRRRTSAATWSDGHAGSSYERRGARERVAYDAPLELRTRAM